VETTYAPLLHDRDALDRETLWLEMYNKLRDHGRKGSAIEALSAIDIALWDIAGKHFGVPIYRLLGRRYRQRVAAYATGLYRRRDRDSLADLVPFPAG
jgi:D-galactarolactone cycloisomerase